MHGARPRACRRDARFNRPPMDKRAPSLPIVPSRPAKKRRQNVASRHLCAMGTGEVVHILSYRALPDAVDAFELVVQGLARELYAMEASVTDVRVCHPRCGEVVLCLTFITKAALEKFAEGPQRTFEASLRGLVAGGPGTTSSSSSSSSLIPTSALTSSKCLVSPLAVFSASGTLMPAAHTLHSLVEYLRQNVHGTDHTAHDVRAVSKELEKWFPRPSEYSQYVRLDKAHPKKYTRNLIYGNEHFDCILMCWPSGSMSSIHGHDKSSCWVNVVEGTVHEVQYALPQLDKKFLEAEKNDPAGAVGHCGRLKVVNVAKLDTGGVVGTYANNDVGIHRVENRTDKLACTVHIYAPPLRKMKIFNEDGRVHVHVATANLDSREGGTVGQSIMGPEGHASGGTPCFDVVAWNGTREECVDC